MATMFSEYEDRGARRTSFALFLAITLFFLAAFSVIPMPSQEFADRKVETLMLERIIFESMEDLSTSDSEEPEQEPEVMEPEESVTGDDDEAATEDLEELMEAFGEFAFSEIGLDDAAMDEEAQIGAPAILHDDALDIESDDIADVFHGRSLDLTSDLVTQETDRGRSTRSLRSGLLSGRVSGEAHPGFRRITGSGSGDGEGLDLRGNAGNSGDLLESARGDAETGEREIDFSMPRDAVADWIELNQAPLDPGIRSLFRYSSTNITAKELISVGGQSYGLQLMYSPSSGEIHIALLDGDVIFYFIDPGFQKRANYFQKGTVRRDDATLVILVESEDLSPRGEEALRFYELFLTWWAEEEKGL